MDNQQARGIRTARARCGSPGAPASEENHPGTSMSKSAWLNHRDLASMTAGFYSACEDVGATHRYVVYGGDDEFPVKHDTTVISLPKLLLKLQDK
jgi:hypothetical protein